MDAHNAKNNPQDIARACADAMWSTDRASKGLGFNIEMIALGQAVISMTVKKDMTNGFGICHGGFIFTLADSAFAFACNTYNQRTVAQQCAVTFIKPAFDGEKLTARAIERMREGRSGIYDVTVTNESNVIVAEFRGHSRTIKGELLNNSTQSAN